MTRTKRFLAAAFLAASVAVGTTTPALADIHATSHPATEKVGIDTNSPHAT
ncbi:hypothetical protein [Streptomyces sp. Root431]|uniref:hypothetical protein n=1 Tax=Streptomyces sp. Root431 TaxID=1736535 RepID=UPI000A8BB57F|nr:hypothetical protein [Streptomyces sp. Root431]